MIRRIVSHIHTTNHYSTDALSEKGLLKKLGRKNMTLGTRQALSP
jgi:hypothetical protein